MRGNTPGRLAVAGLLLALLVAPGAARAEIFVASLKSIIHPIAASYVAEALEEAEAAEAELFVLELNTPGGLLDSTRDISSTIQGSEVPVAVFVSPSGAQAASAGFFILMSSDVAAMAPGTNTGAAHPVAAQGEDMEEIVGKTMGEKVEQDTAAFIRSLAEGHGRNVELAESAVMESRSFTAEEAMAQGLIEFLEPNLDRLIEALDGHVVRRGDEEPTVLSTRGVAIRRLDMSPVQRFLSALAHPNLAYLLLSLGWMGLMIELWNPGAIFPGVLGGLCLILGLYGISVLPVNYAGVALLLLAIFLFLAEVKVPSFGLLSVGGAISLLIGSLMLFKSPDPALRVSLSVVIAMVASSVLVTITLVRLVVKALQNRVTTGQEGLVGEVGVVKRALDPSGKVFVHGEFWGAAAEDREMVVPVGTEVEVTKVQGMTLVVRPLAPLPTAGEQASAIPEEG